MASLNNFTNKSGGDNLLEILQIGEKEKLVFGADNSYTYKYDISFNEIDDLWVLVNQGGKIFKEYEWKSFGGRVSVESIGSGKAIKINFDLSSDDSTLLAKHSNLDVSLQIKFKFKQEVGSILAGDYYGDIVELETINTLDNQLGNMIVGE